MNDTMISMFRVILELEEMGCYHLASAMRAMLADLIRDSGGGQ